MARVGTKAEIGKVSSDIEIKKRLNMPSKKGEEKDRTAELLEKMLVFQLWALGIPQGRIATTVGRQRAWVNNLIKGIPKGGKSDGEKEKGKKAKG